LQKNNICNSCKLQIHPNFVGHHKCGYGNCPICKTAVTNSRYWYHIKSHTGHENYYDDHLEITSAPIIVVTATRGKYIQYIHSEAFRRERGGEIK
jgi:hypothetical protein